jgi:hypothetical protein
MAPENIMLSKVTQAQKVKGCKFFLDLYDKCTHKYIQDLSHPHTHTHTHTRRERESMIVLVGLPEGTTRCRRGKETVMVKNTETMHLCVKIINTMHCMLLNNGGVKQYKKSK